MNVDDLLQRLEILAPQLGGLQARTIETLHALRLRDGTRSQQLMTALSTAADPAVVLPSFRVENTDELQAALSALVQALENYVSTHMTFESTLVRSAPPRTISDTSISAVKAAPEPIMFGAPGVVADMSKVETAPAFGQPSAIPQPKISARGLANTHVKSINSSTPPSQIPDAAPRKNLGLVIAIFTAACGMALGLIFLKGGTVAKSSTQASMVALDTMYTTWKEPSPPGPCRRPEDFDRIARSMGNLAELAEERRPSPELAYLAAKGTWDTSKTRLPMLEFALRCDGFAGAHNLSGRIAFAEKNYGLAAKEYETAIEQSPGFAKAHYNYALLLIQLGKFPEAIGQTDLALNADRTFGESWFARGLANTALGNTEAAAQDFCKGSALGSKEAAERCPAPPP